MMRSQKYRLYPHKPQESTLSYLLDLSRNVYNAALEQRITTYQETGDSVWYSEQWEYFRDSRRVDPDGLGLLNATCLQQTLRRLDKAYRAFFRRVKSGETPGFPRFKSRDRWKSLDFTYGDGCKLRFDKTNRAMLYLQNIGEVKIKYHREIPQDSKIKHLVVKRINNKWYAIFQIEMPDKPFFPREESAVGVDMGLHSLLALSDGNFVENPRWFRESERELRVAQRRLSRRKRGSKNRKDAALQVAKIHERIANQRLDFWHKVTTDLVKEHSVIVLEDLNLSFMLRNHCLAKSAYDAGLGLFRQLLQYKAEDAGTTVLFVNPAYTSQMCSGCGEIVPKDLSVRVHKCECGLVLDRDLNAALSVLNLGLKSAWIEPPDANVSDGTMRSRGSPCFQTGE
jgi:putative transposase